MSDPIQAHVIDVGGCADDCLCQMVHVIMRDAEGEVFAAISLSPDDARSFARDLGEVADLADLARARQAGQVS